MSYHGLGQTVPPLLAEAAPVADQIAQHMARRRMETVAIGSVAVLASLAIASGAFAWTKKRRAR